jgi:hypothetical protein
MFRIGDDSPSLRYTTNPGLAASRRCSHTERTTMHVLRPQDAASLRSDADAVCAAFTTLGLDPAADDVLVDLAVRYHLETCARWSLIGQTPCIPADAVARARRLIAAGLVAEPADFPLPASDPYRLLRVHPAADEALITIVYRNLLARAATAGDESTFQALECAYARIGSPAARAMYDRQRAAPPAAAGSGRLGAAWREVADRCLRLAGAGRRLTASAARRGGTARPAATEQEPGTTALDAHSTLHGPAAASAVQEVAHPVGALRVLEGEREVMTLALRDRASYTIGAGPGAAIRLPAAEREHARLTVGQGWVLFQQLAEHAVSLVNGARSVRALLGPGDSLDIGPYHCQYVIVRYEPWGWRG